ncbi:MAG: arsenate reductase [Gammaproteobacteria bacterium]|nr:arsenate reductase [Gammaproteobacteria bacterium]MBU1505697.1 arsenate reductase [Gammaproteobacteria bacterium]MBU2123054.1 arsenate reductase [Gammaproteobacteria bacterium]MBU2170929.1 arsenate reductase [Gammaproteobacteria bacterium]MBU2200944.1 arsenate reductase [Gammaproteobacteria bacterium]
MMRGMTTPLITVYGIPNCDTVKKSRAWLAEQGAEYQFHDFKKHGVPPDRISEWMAAAGWQKLLNRQGTTWRKLPIETQAAVTDEASASALMQAQPSVVKRPVVEWTHGGRTTISVGFAPEQWQIWLDSLRQA